MVNLLNVAGRLCSGFNTLTIACHGPDLFMFIFLGAGAGASVELECAHSCLSSDFINHCFLKGVLCPLSFIHLGFLQCICRCLLESHSPFKLSSFFFLLFSFFPQTGQFQRCYLQVHWFSVLPAQICYLISLVSISFQLFFSSRICFLFIISVFLLMLLFYSDIFFWSFSYLLCSFSLLNTF